MVGRPKLIIFVEQILKSIVVIILEPWEYINNSKINKEAANSLYSFAISFYDASYHESGRRRDDGGHGCSVLVRPPSGRCPARSPARAPSPSPVRAPCHSVGLHGAGV